MAFDNYNKNSKAVLPFPLQPVDKVPDVLLNSQVLLLRVPDECV